MNQITAFRKCRNLVKKRTKKLINFYFDRQYDPFDKKIIMDGIQDILIKEQDSLGFKEILPKKLYPKCKIRIHEKHMKIEYTIQQYLNEEENLIFLGNYGLAGMSWDLYVRKSFASSYKFIVRHGDKKTDQETDEIEAIERQNEEGKFTPFSVAYTLARNDGLVSDD